MKLLIVDDETHVIEAIQLLIPWQDYHVDTILAATSVAEAKQLLAFHQPNLAFIDIMIGSESGLDLMEHIVTNHNTTKVIAISGHSDFDFVRKMLLYGAIDYLLKPLSRTHLLAATEKAIQTLYDENTEKAQAQTLSQQLSYLSSERQHTLFFQLFSSETNAAAYAELISLDPFFSQSQYCQVLYCDLFFYPYHEHLFSQKFTSFFNALRSKLEHTHEGSTVWINKEHTEAIIILYQRLQENAKSIHRALSSLTFPGEYPIHFGISNKFPTSGILLAYEDAKTSFLNLSLSPIPVSLLSSNNAILPKLYSDEHLEKHIFTMILNGDVAKIKEMVSKWIFSIVSEKSPSFFTIKFIHLQFTTIFNHWTKSLSEKYEHFEYSQVEMPIGIYSLLNTGTESFKEYLSDRYTEECVLLSRKLRSALRANNLSHQVSNYMQLNYMHKFNQAEYADRFHVNKEYLCRKFKDVYGISMLTFLNEIRIEHAKSLLCTTDLKVYTISSDVGFEDYRYFVKKFKKATNMTPNEYRTIYGSNQCM